MKRMDDSDINLRKRRKEVSFRKRRIIFNDDGGASRIPGRPLTSQQDFLSVRSSPLVGSQVDTILFCTTAGTFGRFYHRTLVGEIASDREGRYHYSIIPDFIEQGTDPLEIMVEFCRKNEIEVFWSLRMNDTHDASNPLLVPHLKKDNPDLLLGSEENPPKYGAWTAVDYGRAKIRELCYEYIAEVVENYGVDGIELDFFRHPVFFSRTGDGLPVSPGDLNSMTALIRRIRRLLDKVSLERETPLLLAVLVPDSLEYCSLIGLNVGLWLAEELVDILLPTGYFRLNDWEYSVALGRKHGVPVYPCLQEPRLLDEEAKLLRCSKEVFRARAMNVWYAGASGVYLFNYFNTRNPLFFELGEPEELRRLDKIYFPSVRGVGRPAGRPVPYRDYMKIPVLSPDWPVRLSTEKNFAIDIQVGDDVSAMPKHRSTPNARLRLRLDKLDNAQELDVTCNGNTLKDGEIVEGWIEFRVDPAQIVPGKNRITLRKTTSADSPRKLQDMYLLLWYQEGMPPSPRGCLSLDTRTSQRA